MTPAALEWGEVCVRLALAPVRGGVLAGLRPRAPVRLALSALLAPQVCRSGCCWREARQPNGKPQDVRV